MDSLGMRRLSKSLCVVGLILFVAARLPAGAAAAETGDVPTPPEPGWQVQADAGLVTSGSFSGWAVGMRGLKLWHQVGVGLDVESSSLSASGIAPDNQLPFQYSFHSTYIGGMVRMHQSIGRITPYLDIGGGHVSVSRGAQENTQCSYLGGFDIALAGGADARIVRGLALGLRLAVRLPFGSGGCDQALGPWSFELGPIVSFAIAAGYQW
jgi:hypothetical protein